MGSVGRKSKGVGEWGVLRGSGSSDVRGAEGRLTSSEKGRMRVSQAAGDLGDWQDCRMVQMVQSKIKMQTRWVNLLRISRQRWQSI